MRKRDVCKLAGIIFVGEPGLYIVVKCSAFAIRIPSAHLGRGGGEGSPSLSCPEVVSYFLPYH